MNKLAIVGVWTMVSVVVAIVLGRMTKCPPETKPLHAVKGDC